jgi:hypothetical protein
MAMLLWSRLRNFTATEEGVERDVKKMDREATTSGLLLWMNASTPPHTRRLAAVWEVA